MKKLKSERVEPMKKGMGAPKKADWREERRKRAWELKQAGRTQKEIAEVLGVTEGAVIKSDAQAQEREEKKRSKPTRQKEPGPV